MRQLRQVRQIVHFWILVPSMRIGLVRPAPLENLSLTWIMKMYVKWVSRAYFFGPQWPSEAIEASEATGVLLYQRLQCISKPGFTHLSMQISGSELFSNEWSKIHIFWPFLGPAGPLGPRGEKEPRLRYQWVQLIEKQEKKNLTKKIFFDQKLPFYRQGLLKIFIIQ